MKALCNYPECPYPIRNKQFNLCRRHNDERLGNVKHLPVLCSYPGCLSYHIRNHSLMLCRRHNEERLSANARLTGKFPGCKRLCEDCQRPLSEDRSSRCAPCYHESRRLYSGWEDRPLWGGCHEWQGPMHNQTTPQFKRNNETKSVRREVWECLAGEISQGFVVRATCANPKCFWIGHLCLATHKIGKVYSPGGRFYDKKGYAFIVQAEGRAVREHVSIMEEYLGRKVETWENVHHINGVKDDNRLANLELWSIRQPKGQRVRDLVEWAWEIIELYDKEVEDKGL